MKETIRQPGSEKAVVVQHARRTRIRAEPAKEKFRVVMTERNYRVKENKASEGRKGEETKQLDLAAQIAGDRP
jgi:hypothetical protein